MASVILFQAVKGGPEKEPQSKAVFINHTVSFGLSFGSQRVKTAASNSLSLKNNKVFFFFKPEILSVNLI